MEYIIQTRQENNNRGLNSKIKDSNSINQKEWTNYNQSFAALDQAAAECQSMIESGNFNARNIRVVRIEMIFKSKTIVEQLEP